MAEYDACLFVYVGWFVEPRPEGFIGTIDESLPTFVIAIYRLHLCNKFQSLMSSFSMRLTLFVFVKCVKIDRLRKFISDIGGAYLAERRKEDLSL